MTATTARDVEFTRARAQVYGLLSAVFDGDIDTLVNAFERDAFDHLAALLPVDIETVSMDEPDVEALKIGYDNLFVVPGPHFVPSFASAYADGPSAEQFESDSSFHDEGAAGELMGSPAAKFGRLYGRAGFQPTTGDGIPDHIAAVLEFMSALANEEGDLRSVGDEEGAEEFRELQVEVVALLGWLDTFDERVNETDRAEGVFASLVTFARAFVAWDARDHLDAA